MKKRPETREEREAHRRVAEALEASIRVTEQARREWKRKPGLTKPQILIPRGSDESKKLILARMGK